MHRARDHGHSFLGMLETPAQTHGSVNSPGYCPRGSLTVLMPHSTQGAEWSHAAGMGLPSFWGPRQHPRLWGHSTAVLPITLWRQPQRAGLSRLGWLPSQSALPITTTLGALGRSARQSATQTQQQASPAPPLFPQRGGGPKEVETCACTPPSPRNKCMENARM